MIRLLTVLALITLAAPASAEPCEGFTNAMGALEAQMKIAQSQPAQTEEKTAPPIQSINQSLDALEKAVAEHRARIAQSEPTR